MEVLQYLQSIRTEWLTKFVFLITNLGSEIIVIGVVCFLFWCHNKKFAYRLGFVYFLSGLAVQTLKIVFKIPRPWILDKSIVPVKEAVSTATGYSFPSGHTQSATALYGTLAYNVRKKWFQLIMLVIILAVGFSRMYLGVHTPMDVAVSLLVTILITVACNYVIDSKLVYKLRQEMLAIVLLMIPLLMVGYAVIQIHTGSVELENVSDYLKAAGAALGFVAGWYLETRHLNFDETKGSILAKALRFIIGVASILAFKQGLKYIIGDSLPADFIRYAITIFWGIYLYPLIYTKIEK